MSSILLRSGIGGLRGVSQRVGFSSRVMSSSVITLSDNEAVEKFTALNNKAILYFTATWCPPCKMIKPVYEKISSDHPEVKFGKVDVDDNQEASMNHEIQAVPTFIVFKDNGVIDRFSGADQKQLEGAVKKLKSA
jgi:thioredoxin 1